MTNPEVQAQRAHLPRGETQSMLTVADYIHLFLRYRIWFLVGLGVVMGLTFFSVKFVSTKFYRAESSFFINNRIPPEQLVGMTDAGIFQPRQNESFQTAVLAQVAQRTLTSNDLLTSAVAMVEQKDPGIRIAELLKIKDEDPERRRRLLLQQLTKDLVRVSAIEGNGIAELQVEMPDPKVAATFNDALLVLLQREFSKFMFGYFIKARELYTNDLAGLQTQQVRLAEELREFNRQYLFDKSETIEERRTAMEEKMKLFSTQIAELSLRVQNLRLATSDEALAAAQPIHIINHPEAPLKKSRPQTIATTLISGVLYTFVFFAAMMFLGIFQALRASGLKL